MKLWLWRLQAWNQKLQFYFMQTVDSLGKNKDHVQKVTLGELNGNRLCAANKPLRSWHYHQQNFDILKRPHISDNIAQPAKYPSSGLLSVGNTVIRIISGACLDQFPGCCAVCKLKTCHISCFFGTNYIICNSAVTWYGQFPLGKLTYSRMFCFHHGLKPTDSRYQHAIISPLRLS